MSQRADRQSRLWGERSQGVWTVLGGVVAVGTAVVTALGFFLGNLSGPDGQPAGTAGVTGTPTAAGVTLPARPTGSSTAVIAAGTGPTPLLDARVTLPYGSAADLDGAAAEVEPASGPLGEFDIRYGDAFDLKVSRAVIYDDSGPADGAYDRCLALTRADTGGRPGAAVYGAGPQYCFLTDRQNLAWVRLDSRSGTSTQDSVLVLEARVWPAAP